MSGNGKIQLGIKPSWNSINVKKKCNIFNLTNV